MVTREIRADIEAIERNAALYEELNFESRTETLDYLEFHVIDRIDGLYQTTDPLIGLLPLKQYAETLKHRLEAIDIALFERLRATIRLGHYSGATLLELINQYVGQCSDSRQAHSVIGYDTLDVFTNGLLAVWPLPVDIEDSQPEMIYYQKTPARIVVELIGKARFTSQDVFYDLGSGLGHVSILVNLLGDVTAKGIDVEPAYCLYANACAADLNLSRVTFIQADARTADFPMEPSFSCIHPLRVNY